MEFIESPAFPRSPSEYLSDESYRELQNSLVADPDTGDLMPGTGGFRKIRWRDARRGKGRRGGLRVIYYHFAHGEQIWLMAIYGKNEASDLTAKEKKALTAAIESELEERTARRTTAPRVFRRT